MNNQKSINFIFYIINILPLRYNFETNDKGIIKLGVKNMDNKNSIVFLTLISLIIYMILFYLTKTIENHLNLTFPYVWLMLNIRFNLIMSSIKMNRFNIRSVNISAFYAYISTFVNYY